MDPDPTQHFDSWTIGLKTNSEFGNAEIDDASYGAIKKKLGILDENTVPVVTGFIAHDPDGHVTTLGRGGSDLSAAVIAAACGLDEIQVWKDVDGMLTADPRIIPSAVPVPAVTFEEASELAYFGAKILHPVSMLPAMRANIPVRVKNSYNPGHPGTVISGRAAGRSRNNLVTAITTKSQQTVLDIVSTRMLGQVRSTSYLLASVPLHVVFIYRSHLALASNHVPVPFPVLASVPSPSSPQKQQQHQQTAPPPVGLPEHLVQGFRTARPQH